MFIKRERKKLLEDWKQKDENEKSIRRRFAMLKFLSQEECKQLLDTIRANNSRYAKRDLFLFTFMLHTALRLFEVQKLNIADVKDRQWLSFIGKGRKKGTIPLNSFIQDKIRIYLTEEAKHRKLNATSALFTSRFGKRLARCSIQFKLWFWCKKAGIDNFSPHKLRHTALTRLYHKTKDIRLTQEFARHSSINSTMIYTHITPEQLVAGAELLTV